MHTFNLHRSNGPYLRTTVRLLNITVLIRSWPQDGDLVFIFSALHKHPIANSQNFGLGNTVHPLVKLQSISCLRWDCKQCCLMLLRLLTDSQFLFFEGQKYIGSSGGRTRRTGPLSDFCFHQPPLVGSEVVCSCFASFITSTCTHVHVIFAYHHCLFPIILFRFSDQEKGM